MLSTKNFIASECGLIDKWMQSYRSSTDKLNQIECTNLKLGNFYFEFVIYVSMISSALLMILIEKTTFYKARTMNAPSFWRYLEMAIDLYRHFFLKNIDWGQNKKCTFSELFHK